MCAKLFRNVGGLKQSNVLETKRNVGVITSVQIAGGERPMPASSGATKFVGGGTRKLGGRLIFERLCGRSAF